LGDAAEEVLNYVRSEGIDLVIMGTHGRKGLEKVVFGSVAERVVQKSPVPVLTINPHSKAA
jgi:nucleotide-binding universal stress UspA family protein